MLKMWIKYLKLLAAVFMCKNIACIILLQGLISFFLWEVIELIMGKNKLFTQWIYIECMLLTKDRYLRYYFFDFYHVDNITSPGCSPAYEHSISYELFRQHFVHYYWINFSLVVCNYLAHRLLSWLFKIWWKRHFLQPNVLIAWLFLNIQVLKIIFNIKKTSVSKESYVI